MSHNMTRPHDQLTPALRKSMHLMLAVLCLQGFFGAGFARADAGLLTGGATALEPLTLSVVTALAKAPYQLESGKYYKIDIICDGSGELALGGAEFFRNIWIDEIIINDIEIRPLGLNSIEFDDEGTVTIKFIAIRPGNFVLRIPGSTGETQRAVFNIR